MNLYELAARDGTTDRIAHEAVRSMEPDERDDMLVTLLASRLDAIRRESVREVERGNVATFGPRAGLHAKLKQDIDERQAESDARWAAALVAREPIQAAYIAGEIELDEAWYLAQAAGAASIDAFVEVDPGEPPSAHVYGNYDGPDDYKSEGQLSRLRAKAAKERQRRDQRERSGLMRLGGWADDLGVYLDQFKRDVRLELTAELLAASFALGDGRTVTWGSATIADHEARVQLQLKHAAGSMEDAERHRAAIALINAQGTTCLGEIAVAA